VEGYELLTISFNHALRALRKITVPPLRESTDLLPLFHRNDPQLMIEMPNGSTLPCGPDIILVSLADTRAAHVHGGEWADYAFNMAMNAPQKDFHWSSPLSVVEFRRIKCPLMPPLTEYTVKPMKVIRPQIILYDGEDLPTQEEVTQPSLEVISNQSNPVPISVDHSRSSCPTSSQSNASLSPACRSRKLSCEDGDMSSGRMDISPERLPAALQSGLYAAERLSRAIWTSHMITLVIINDVAYVWWYDKQGAIQSHGINFIQDLPYRDFLVLLLCFERFTPENWGVIPAFDLSGLDAGHLLFSECRLSETR